MDKKDGGPAFARPMTIAPHGSVVGQSQSGMSMRDWFAGQALAGCDIIYHDSDNYMELYRGYAQRAYEMADAMLAEKRKEKTDDR